MHKKHHKLHRHKDVSHKRAKTRHKHHKKERPVSQSILEPIIEVSREKLKIDKNACGDHDQATLLTDLKSKHRKKKDKTKNHQPDKEEIDIFTRNYLQQIRVPSNQKVIRHHSLEKSGEGLLDKTKKLFRKEKSLNDADLKIIGNVEIQTNEKNGKKQRHKSRKEGKDKTTNDEEKHKHHDKATERKDNNYKVDKVERETKSRSKSRKKTGKSPKCDDICNRVQEVIYCHMEQIPYKMKNDKSATEVKDLYKRIKKEKRRYKHRERKEKSHSRSDLKKSILERERSSESPTAKRMSIEDKNKSEEKRSGSSKRDKAEVRTKEKQIENKEEKRHSRKGRHHHCDDLDDAVESSRKRVGESESKNKHKKRCSANVDLGPYNKYFAFENKGAGEKCCQQQLRDGKTSQDKRQEQECKKHREKIQEETERQKIVVKTDEEKIHKIIEGDLKNYFSKIQHMIDSKLDALLEAKKSERNNEEEKRKKEKSKTDKETNNKERKADVDRVNRSKNDDKVRKEEIIQEVLKRIKNEEQEKKTKDALKRIDGKQSKDVEIKYEHKEKDKTDKREMTSRSRHRSRKIEDACLEENKIDKHQRRNEDRVSRSSNKEQRSEDPRNKHNKSDAKNTSRLNVEDPKRMRSELDGKVKIKPGSRRSRSRHHVRSSPRSNKIEKQQLSQMPSGCNQNIPSLQREISFPSANSSYFVPKVPLSSERRHRSPHTHVRLRGDVDPSYHDLRKHYTSASSCRACSDSQFDPSQLILERPDQNQFLYGRNSSSKEVQQSRKRLEDVIRQYYCHEKVSCCRMPVTSQEKLFPCVPSRDVAEDRDSSTADSFNIISPPEMFKNDVTLERCSRSKSTLEQEYRVQGIEPPISDRPGKNLPIRQRRGNFECKTVSIIGIPPQNTKIDEAVMASEEKKTSEEFRGLVTPDQELVEKRKHTKRFRLYYRYSNISNCREDKESGASDGKSIVSDSCRMISDPSEDDRAKERHPCLAEDREQRISEQVSTKKYTRVATPRDSHLNNIIEEPSKVLKFENTEDYFIPIKETNECYFRSLTSSHSEYCFKINRKQANSNISVRSRETCDGKYRYPEQGRCRFCKRSAPPSKSDFKIESNATRTHVFRSKSDVFLVGISGKKAIKSILLEDTHPYVKTRRRGSSPVANSLNRKRIVVSTTTECQTSVQNAAQDENDKSICRDKHEQFKDIYKTIDVLEENIQNARKTPPKTSDAAVGTEFTSLDEVSDRKPQFKAIYKTIDNLEDKMIRTSAVRLVETADAAIGTLTRIRRSCKSEPRKSVREVGVGGSRGKSPGYRSVSRGKKLTSTGVSPIRLQEEMQVSQKKFTGKNTTPRIAPVKPNPIRSPVVKKIADKVDEVPLRRAAPKPEEAKKDVPLSSTKKPKMSPVKDSIVVSPQRTPAPNRSIRHPRNVNTIQPVPAVRVLRSAERSTSVKRGDEKPSVVKPFGGEGSGAGAAIQQDEAPSVVKATGAETVRTGFATHRSEDTRPVIVIPRTPIRKRELSKESGSTPKKQAQDLHRSCIHHFHPKDIGAERLSNMTTPTKKLASSSSPKPVTVHAALFETSASSRKSYIGVESSTSSSVGDSSGQNVRRSKSLVELGNQRPGMFRSKTDVLSVGQALLVYKPDNASGTMEKYANSPKLRGPQSRSNLHSLDQFLGNKFASRLLLTKDYKGAEMSSYQRRKLYDQSIRQKMKRKFKFSKLDVGPQIFEVRFLSMVNPESLCKRDNEATKKRYFDRPLLALSLGKLPAHNFQDDLKYFGDKEESTGSPGAVDFAPAEVDNSNIVTAESKAVHNLQAVADNLEANNEENAADNVKAVTDNLEADNEETAADDLQAVADDLEACVDSEIQNVKTVTQLYFNGASSHEDTLMSFCNKLLDVNSCSEIEDELRDSRCSCSKYSDDCRSCKNFVKLLGIFCSSLASYCEPSGCNLANFSPHKADSSVQRDVCDAIDEIDIVGCYKETLKANDDIESPERQDSPRKVDDISALPSVVNSNSSTNPSDRIFKNRIDYESLSTVNRTDDSVAVYQPVSCPALPTNTSSFEFLYEESSSSDNTTASRERVFADLTKPFDQTFSFSTSQYNVETPFIQTSHFSGTGSTESGYASVNSKSRSIASFFKKPHIAALLKSPNSSENCEASGHRGQGDFVKSELYKQMTKSCQLYARKVREMGERKVRERLDEYREFSLEFLLGKNNFSVLESRSLGLESDVDDQAGSEGLPAIDVSQESVEDGEDGENLYPAVSEEDGTLESEISFIENGCKLVLSNDCLKIDSVTYLEPEIFHEEGGKGKVHDQDSCSKTSKENSRSEAGESSFTLDFSLDSSNPFAPSKDSLTKKLFRSLLKVYEQEMELCRKLFENDQYMDNVLLPALKEKKDEEKKKRRRGFGRIFRRRASDVQINNEDTESIPMTDSQMEVQKKLRALACEAKKCFSMLAEAVTVNENIDDEMKICGLLKLLGRIERGDFRMMQKYGGGSNLEEDIKSRLKDAFLKVYTISEKEAKKRKRQISEKEINLIKHFVGKYRVGLLSKTDIVACYIGSGVIETEAHLKAAVTYLMRCHSDEVDAEKFEEYCNFSKPSNK